MTVQPQPALATQQIDVYLAALRACLAPITLGEREEIVREISAHIRDSVEESGLPIEKVLARLGSPEEIAAQYRDGSLVRRAAESVSPVLLLRATLRLATKGLMGTLVFLSAFTGYVAGVSLVLMGLLKPFLPHSTGLWIDKSTTTAGTLPQAPAFGIQPGHTTHELLGWWAIPVGLLGGAIVLVVTTLAVRFFLRASQRLQSRLGAPLVSAG